MTPCQALIVERIRAGGPMTFAAFMELALYHPEQGYYARVARRSGRAGDFVTSVDVSPVFGELLARQFAEMWRLLERSAPASRFDLVEAGAGNGRLARDVLDAAAAWHPDLYAASRLHLIEASAAARAQHIEVLGPHADRLCSSGTALPDAATGVIFANELLDALPTHAVVMTADGLRELFVDIVDDHLIERALLPSTPEIARYLDRLGVTLGLGWRAEVNLAATAWVEDASRVLRRGFLVLIDYGHEAAYLYSAAHRAGTRAAFFRQTSEPVRSGNGQPAWLVDPGERDITADVDLTSIRHAAEREGLQTVGILDQTYFVLGLCVPEFLESAAGATGPEDFSAREEIAVGRAFRPVVSGSGLSTQDSGLRRRLALKTLMLPGGLGSSHKVAIFGREVGAPALRGCSYRMRLT